MKIKPEDLRIGNVVLQTYSNYKFVIKEIKSQMFNTFLSLLPYGQDNNMSSRIDETIDGVKAFPLSLEMLPGLGFTYNPKNDNWFIDYERDGNRRVFVVRNDAGEGLGLFCYLFDCVTFDLVSLCLTPSLHILQNIFYFTTGKELEVKL